MNKSNKATSSMPNAQFISSLIYLQCKNTHHILSPNKQDSKHLNGNKREMHNGLYRTHLDGFRIPLTFSSILFTLLFDRANLTKPNIPCAPPKTKKFRLNQ